MSEFYEVDHPGPSLLENFLAINSQWGPQKTTRYIPNNKSSSCRWKAVKKVKLFDQIQVTMPRMKKVRLSRSLSSFFFSSDMRRNCMPTVLNVRPQMTLSGWSGASQNKHAYVCVCVYIIHRIYLIYTVSLFASSVNDLIYIYIYVYIYMYIYI